MQYNAQDRKLLWGITERQKSDESEGDLRPPAVSKDVAEELFSAIRKGMHGDFGLGNDVTGQCSSAATETR
jgi:hypothetical protein